MQEDVTQLTGSCKLSAFRCPPAGGAGNGDAEVSSIDSGGHSSRQRRNPAGVHDCTANAAHCVVDILDGHWNVPAAADIIGQYANESAVTIFLQWKAPPSAAAGDGCATDTADVTTAPAFRTRRANALQTCRKPHSHRRKAVQKQLYSSGLLICSLPL